MAKNKTEIHVTTVFDGELDATDVFVSLISQKYGKTNTKEYLAKKKDLKYNEDEVQKSQIPSLSCRIEPARLPPFLRRAVPFFTITGSSPSI